MLITVPNKAKTPTVNQLVKIWAKRYVPDLSSVKSEENSANFQQQLIQKASLQSRIETAAKITRRVIALKCQMASLKAKSLYAYFPTAITFTDTQRLSDFALLIYLKLAEIYQQPPLSSASEVKIRTAFFVSNEVNDDSLLEDSLSMEDWGMPSIENLAVELEPLLLEFQKQHILSEDKRTLGFLTTLLNFCNDLILQGMTITEQLLIYPYFKFVEEQVALPWQRVCLAASHHELDSLSFVTAANSLPQAEAIARRTYNRLVENLPHHHSRRGLLKDTGVSHSTLRDLQMNQAYLWLSVLEGTLSSVEDELVPLCTLVFPAIGVSWELITLSNQVLFDELLAVMSQAQADHIRPYVNEYVQAFNRRQSEFQEIPEGVRTEAKATSLNPLEALGQLQSQAAGSKSPMHSDAVGHQDSPTAEPLPNASDIARLQAKMAKLEAELGRIIN